MQDVYGILEINATKLYPPKKSRSVIQRFWRWFIDWCEQKAIDE